MHETTRHWTKVRPPLGGIWVLVKEIALSYRSLDLQYLVGFPYYGKQEPSHFSAIVRCDVLNSAEPDHLVVG